MYQIDTSMQNLKIKKIILTVFFISIIFISDQLSKYLMENFFITNTQFQVQGFYKITSFFNIVQVYNTGVSFGILNSSSKYLLLVLNFAICCYLLYLICKADKMRNVILFSSIIGGALGNGIDRIYRVGVLDFLDFHVLNFHWPSFNVADIAICMAVAFIIFFDVYDNWNRSRTA